MKRLLLFLVAVLLAATKITAQQDTALITALLKNIAQQQVASDGFFYKGLFPSFRECGGAPHNYQHDNNIFYTAAGVFALKKMLPYLSAGNRHTATSIIERATATYPKYQNKKGKPFYNFWPSNSVIMPGTFIFQYLKGVFGQGEDADDSVMILLGLDSNNTTCRLLKQQMIGTANLSRKKIISTYKKYRNVPAYSTWLGYRMTPDFDFAVQCNILYFSLDKQLPLVRQDSATIGLLADMVKERLYLKNPVFLSPYYVHSAVLVYHLARLMGAFSIPALDGYKKQLTDDIIKLLANSNNVMDQVILRTALLRLGADAPPLPVGELEAFEQSNQRSFVFFQARAAFPYPAAFKQVFLHWSYINYYFYCPVYNKILWLEYLVEKQKRMSAM